MDWEELKEKFNTHKVIKIPCKNLAFGYRFSNKEVEAITFRGLFFTEDGDIFCKTDDTTQLYHKIKHVPFCEGNEKMWQIMEALK